MKKSTLSVCWKSIVFAVFYFTCKSALAVDTSSRLTEAIRIGKWHVMEIAADSQLIYRVGATSSNVQYMNLTFDFAPTLNCNSNAAVMIQRIYQYDSAYDDGVFLFSYKIPGKKESTEMLSSVISKGDVFVFFQFKKLTPNILQQSNGKGSLAIWMPASGDGAISRSSNIYFSLAGFPEALRFAQQKCRESL